MALLDIAVLVSPCHVLLNYTHRLEPSERVTRLASKVRSGKIFVTSLDHTTAEHEKQTRLAAEAAEAMPAPKKGKGAKGPLPLVPTPPDWPLNKDADLQWLNDAVALFVETTGLDPNGEAYDTMLSEEADVVDIGAKEGEPVIQVRVRMNK